MELKPTKFELNAEDIASGKYDAMELVTPLWFTVDIYEDKSKYDADLAPFTAAQRGVFAVMWYDAEVCNGGHDQFFCNSTGIVWEDALAGLKLIGAEKCASILEKVIGKWGGNIPFDRQERCDLMEKMPEDIFSEDDDDYYEYSGEIRECAEKYAAAHPSEFVFSGEIDIPENC